MTSFDDVREAAQLFLNQNARELPQLDKEHAGHKEKKPLLKLNLSANYPAKYAAAHRCILLSPAVVCMGS